MNSDWIMPLSIPAGGHRVGGDTNDEMRVKGYLVPGLNLMHLFYGSISLTDGSCLTVQELDLPVGYHVIGARLLRMPAGIELFVEHPSFDPVPLGSEPPRIAASYKFVVLKRIADEGNFECYSVKAGAAGNADAQQR